MELVHVAEKAQDLYINNTLVKFDVLVKQKML